MLLSKTAIAFTSTTNYIKYMRISILAKACFIIIISSMKEDSQNGGSTFCMREIGTKDCDIPGAALFAGRRPPHPC